jgi:hypothetical protein
LLIATAGLWMALPVPAQEGDRLTMDSHAASSPRLEPAENQRLADAIAERLRQSNALHQYRIEVLFKDGTAELNGTVADQPQHDEALQIVRGMPGVEQVIDHVSSGDLTPVQAVVPPVICPSPGNGLLGPGPNGGVPGNGLLGPAPNGGVVEPQPVFQAPAPGPYDLNAPKMPPYAWPTYAPYNNYSRVGYPTLYPHQSFPFIGPLYPFPKVPLGWRAVKLEWQDGHWWLSRYATPHDWWMLKYW